jgi:hypothetical protein
MDGQSVCSTSTFRFDPRTGLDGLPNPRPSARALAQEIG